MRTLLLGMFIVAVLVGVGAGRASAQDAKRILFLSTSESFAHGPIVQQDGKPSVADEVLSKLAKDLGATFTTTKDASLINAANLKNYDLVIFYTQGDLTKPNKEGAPPAGENGATELIAWVKDGGGFLGFHSATDTFDADTEEASPYIEMLGAEFRSHGAQFTGTVRVVDPDHPTVAHVPDGWKLMDEWYLFRKFNTKAMRVLALLEPGEERAKQEAYDIPAYPIIWVSEVGKGRVYYNAMGHREDVWTNPTFQKAVADAIEWATGKGDAKAKPNYDAVVLTEKPGEPPQEEASAPERERSPRR